MQKENSKKKYVVMSSSLLVAGLVLFASTPSRAVFTPGASVTKNATATLVGTGVVSMTVTVKKMSDDSAATDIAWTGVTLPTGWKNADHYVQLDSTVTAATGGIRLVTDNTTAGANPQYTGPATTAGGLVDNVNPSVALSLAWTIKDSVVGSTGPVSDKPFETGDVGRPSQFQWLFMTDQANVTLAPGAPYRTMINSAGIHFGGGDTEFGGAASPNIVYLEANFATAITPRTYSTNRLIVESFTE